MRNIIALSVGIGLLFNSWTFMAKEKPGDKGPSAAVKCTDCQRFHNCMNRARTNYDSERRSIQRAHWRAEKNCSDRFPRASDGWGICMAPANAIYTVQMGTAWGRYQSRTIGCCGIYIWEAFSCSGYWSRCSGF